jgi:hypothetical protein
MTAEVKQSSATATAKKRGKKIGPSNIEAKRAAALRQAASAAEAERRATGITSTVSFIQLLRDAALTGTIPSNPQLVATIKSWRNSAALSTESLSPTGARLVQDLKVLADLLLEFLQTRNSDELLQRFLHHVHLAGKLAGVNVAIAGWRARGKERRRLGRAGGLQSGGRGKISLWKSQDNRTELFVGGEHSRISGIDSQREASRDQSASATQKQQEKVAKDARALLRIAQQLIVSTDFRDIIVKLQKIGRRIIELAKESDKEQEHEEHREQLESEEGSGNAWEKEPESQKHGSSFETSFEYSERSEYDQELRKLERDEAETSINLYSFRHESHEQYDQPPLQKRHNQQQQQQAQPKTRESVNDMERTDENIPIPSLETARSLPIIQQQGEVKQHETKPLSPRETPKKQSAKSTSGTSKSSRDTKRRQILEDLRELFAQLAGNEQFSRTLRDFYTVLLKMRQNVTAAVAAPQESTVLADELRYDANFRAAQDELLLILERLSGTPGVSLTPLITNLRKVRQEARTDYELRDFLGDWRAYLKRCTSSTDSQKYLDSDEYMRRGEFLLKRTEGYFSSSGDYRSHLDEAYDAFNDYIDGLKSDKLTRDLGRHVNKLVREDLIGIGRGEPLSLRTMLTSSALLRPDLLNDVRYHILPRILQSMQSIPLPRIEVVTGGTVLVLEDLIIPSEALVPLQMEILTSSHVTMNPKSRLFRRSTTPAKPPSARVEGVQGGVQLKLSSIAGQVRNVRFTMDRHEGWPRFNDQGLADLRIGGRGLSILIDLATHPASEITGRSDLRSSILPAALIAHHVHVRIDKLSLNLHDSLHDSIYRVFNPIVSSVVKRNMERAIRDQIINVVDSIDGLLERLSHTVVNN